MYWSEEGPRKLVSDIFFLSYQRRAAARVVAWAERGGRSSFVPRLELVWGGGGADRNGHCGRADAERARREEK